jgi:hypothetical protein
MNGKYFFSCVVFTLGLCAASCVDETAVNHVLGLSAEAPAYKGHRAVSESEMVFEFSKPVKVLSAYFDPPIESEASGSENKVTVKFKKKPGIGARFTADILVEDADGNTLNVLAPFRTRNDKLPKFTMTEIRTEYTKPRGEFIELRTQAAGNLGALRLFAAGNSLEEALYEFPPVDVKKDEYILLHLRTYEEMDCVDETGDDLSLSRPKTDAGLSATAIKNMKADAPEDTRDFWYPANKEVLRKTDIVYFVDQDDTVLDAVMFRAESDKWAKNADFAKAAALLARQGAWEGEPFDNTGTTLTKTICRNETTADSNTAADWYVAPSSGHTPGRANTGGTL